MFRQIIYTVYRWLCNIIILISFKYFPIICYFLEFLDSLDNGITMTPKRRLLHSFLLF